MNKIHLLVADDSLVSRMRIKSVLREIGDFQFSEAKDGKEVMNFLLKDKFDLLILDLMMPNLDGFQVLAEINSNEINIPTIVLTADMQTTTRNKCIKLGAIDIANKSMDLNHLKTAVLDVVSNIQRHEG